ncbi:MAG: hypothetical protein K6D03_05035, partial [Solobacterium sp.]|nr:hypothetical protein [Solobacterium sp.]
MTRSRLYHDRPVHFIVFKDMKHLGFTDMKFLSGKPSSVGKADPETAMNALNEVHVSFFDRYLKNEDIENRTPL